MYENSLSKALSLFSSYELEESQRLLHGRGRCYSDLEQISIDWFSPVILITQYKVIESLNLESLLIDLKACFSNHFPEHQIKCIVFHNRSTPELSTKILDGEFPEQCIAQELISGRRLKFHIDFQYQNIGFFLDARNAREFIYHNVQDKKVLNLFSFTCAFSVSAVAGGAKSVVNLDMGQGVLQRGQQNHQLNQLDLRAATYIKSDLFKAWKKLHKYGRYDVIIIDPPSFQKGSFNAEKDYARIVSNLGKLLMPDAMIVACLNSPFLSESFLDDLFLKNELNNGIHSTKKEGRLDNPKAFIDQNPEAGLKVVIYRYKRLEN